MVDPSHDNDYRSILANDAWRLVHRERGKKKNKTLGEQLVQYS